MIIDKNLASVYDPNMVYNIDDVVVYGNSIYQCIIPDTTGEFNLENWEKAYLTDIFDSTANSTFVNSLAPQYSNESTYKVDSYVLYENTLYKCITEVSEAENFNSEKWEKCYLSDILNGDSDLKEIEVGVGLTWSQGTNTGIETNSGDYVTICISSISANSYAIDETNWENYITISNATVIDINGSIPKFSAYSYYTMAFLCKSTGGTVAITYNSINLHGITYTKITN